MALDDDIIKEIWETAENNDIQINQISYTGLLQSPEYRIQFDLENTTDVDFIKSIFNKYNISMRDWTSTENGEKEVIINPD